MEISYAAIFAFAFTLALTPAVMALAFRFGLVDRPDGLRKLHAKPVARLGGIAICASVALPLCFAASSGVGFLDSQTALYLLTGFAITFFTGLYDDIFGMTAWPKFGGQTVAALVVYAGGLRFAVPASWPLSDAVTLLLTVFWLVGVSNALNLIDGMDGLAGGLGCIGAVTMCAIGLRYGNGDLVMWTLPLAAALIAFLLFNTPPASVFMGDCGSLPVGFLLGCAALILAKDGPITRLAAPMLAIAAPILDTVLTIVRRALAGSPLLRADRGHIHHRLLDSGLSTGDVLKTLYAAAILSGAGGIIIDAAPAYWPVVALILVSGAFYGVRYLRYPEFRALPEALSPAQFLTRLRALIAVHRVEDSLSLGGGPELNRLIARTCEELGLSASMTTKIAAGQPSASREDAMLLFSQGTTSVVLDCHRATAALPQVAEAADLPLQAQALAALASHLVAANSKATRDLRIPRRDGRGENAIAAVGTSRAATSRS